ncbi:MULTISPECIES: AAA family ATPase [Streptomyces]|uniref:AAA family ATPase n=1 Tax=Streptomyces TaxID=1883 RepID=UPI0036599F49
MDFLNADPGSAICARFGHVFEKKGIEPGHKKRILKSFAEKCSEYGEDRPVRPMPSKMGFAVTMPNPEAITHTPTYYDERVASCIDCHWFTPSAEVEAAFGWKGGICQAKGKLIGDGRAPLEAKDCATRKATSTYGASPRTPVGDLMLIVHLDDGFAPKLDPVAAFEERQSNFVDPWDFTSDIEVTDEEKAVGIKAFREIEDPKTGNVVLLPVYDPEFFEPELRELIPTTGDEGHPELYMDYTNAIYRLVVAWRELDETPMVWGPPGTGKTELYRHLAWLMCLPFHRISITASTQVDDLAGKTEFSPEKGTYYQPGRVVKAWQSPGIICVDEPNTGQSDVWQWLRPLTDNVKQLFIDQANGQKIERHSECYLGFAANPAWDARNIGAEPLADADVSRLMHLEIDMPPEAVERRIIQDRCLEDGFEISDDELRLVLSVGETIRSLSNDNVFPGTWGTRNSIKWARLLRHLAPDDAVMMAVGNFLDPEQRKQIMDALDGAQGKQ